MCGCRKNKGGGTAALKAAPKAPLNDPQRIPMKVRVQNFSAEPKAILGCATKISYGRHKDGEEILMWKADVLCEPTLFEVLAEGGQARK